MVRAASMRRSAKPFAQVKNLTKEQEEAVRGSIWKIPPRTLPGLPHHQAHKDSETPPALIEK